MISQKIIKHLMGTDGTKTYEVQARTGQQRQLLEIKIKF